MVRAYVKGGDPGVSVVLSKKDSVHAQNRSLLPNYGTKKKLCSALDFKSGSDTMLTTFCLNVK